MNADVQYHRGTDAVAVDNRRLGLALIAFFGLMLIGSVICILVLN